MVDRPLFSWAAIAVAHSAFFVIEFHNHSLLTSLSQISVIKMLVISKSLFARNQSLFIAGLLENFVVAPT